MSDHEFEKQVRQKLNDLRLTPSGGAWEKIEQGLHSNKRRRVPFLWASLLLLGIAAGGFFWFNAGEKTNGGEVVATSKTVDPQTEPEKQVPVGELQHPEEDKDLPEKSGQIVPNNNPNSKQKLKQKENIEEKIYTTLQSKNNRTPKKITGEEVINQPTQIKERFALTPINQQNREIAYSSLRLNISSSPFNKPLPSSLLNAAHVKNITPSAAEIAAVPKITPLKKWSFGVNTFSGISVINDGNIFNLGEAKVADVTARMTPPSTAAIPNYTASNISPGFSYGAGVFVKRQLNRKFSLTGAVNYLHLSTRHSVGKQVYGNLAVNSGNNNYQIINNPFMLARGRTEDFKNRYHFIEVPVTLNTRLNKSQQYPIHWNMGAAYSQLLSADNLLFDGTTGVYYEDDKLLNKAHVALITGFNIALFNKSRFPVYVGPEIKYNISRLLKKDIPEPKNFLTLGLEVKLLLK